MSGGIKLCGVGRGVPAKAVTNSDLAKIVETSDEWISSRTGISTRHHLDGEPLSVHCLTAAKEALRQANISPEDIGACIVATLSPDTLTPSQACRLQADLGLPNDIPCFDLNAACTGFLFALHTMECLLARSPRPYGLVLGAEALSTITNWTDRSTCVLFGDGAGAAVVRYDKSYPAIHAVLGCHGNDAMLRVDGPGNDGPVQIYMEGTKVFRFAVSAVPWCIDQVLKKSGSTVEDVDFFVFHQANARIIDLAVKNYHIPPEKYYKNIDRYGNTSAASIPLVLSELWDAGKIGPGSKLLIVGFGGGLTWGGALIECM